MAFSSRFLDEVKNRVVLSEVVGKRVRLSKKGREHLGLCPFHSEKTPSFTVNDDKEFYHCFGCGEHGSVFDFKMKTDNISFPEAVELLANECGLEIPVETPEERMRQERANDLYDVLEGAASYFQQMLQASVGKVALDYLIKRGITQESIKAFRLGFAPEGRNNLREALPSENNPDKLLIEAGLRIQPDDGSRSSYDRFRGRIMFPITDQRGRTIAFGGRILKSGEPKYINSPETPLFRKSYNLYAFSQAIKASREKKTIIVTEGYTDVIALHQAGFKNTVAPLGTALTEEQIKLLWKLTPEPVLCFDGDNAGQKAASRVAERVIPILRPERSITFVTLPEGEDPDSLIKTKGPEAFTKLLEQKIHLSEIIWRLQTQGHPLETPEHKAGLEKRLKEVAISIKDKTVRRYYANTFKNRLWTEFNNLQLGNSNGKNKSGLFRNKNKSLQMAPNSGADTKVDTIWIQQAILLVVLINHPKLYDKIGEQLGSLEFTVLELDKLRQEVLETLSLSPEINTHSLWDCLRGAGFSELINKLLSPQVVDHASFARSGENIDIVHRAWEQMYRLFRRNQLLEEIRLVEEKLADNPTAETFELLKALKNTVTEKEDSELVWSNYKDAKRA